MILLRRADPRGSMLGTVLSWGLEPRSSSWCQQIAGEGQAHDSVPAVPDVLHRLHRPREHLDRGADASHGVRADTRPDGVRLCGVRVSVRRHADPRRLAVGPVRTAPCARRAQPGLGVGDDHDRVGGGPRRAGGVPCARRRGRRRGISDRDPRFHVLASGTRARLRAGHHAQFRAPGGSRHASDRSGYLGTIRLAGIVHRARRRQPGLDRGLGRLFQRHAGRAPAVTEPSWPTSAPAVPRRDPRAARPHGARSSAACGSSRWSISVTAGRCGCS